jgi:hypothetical protein
MGSPAIAPSPQRGVQVCALDFFVQLQRFHGHLSSLTNFYSNDKQRTVEAILLDLIEHTENLDVPSKDPNLKNLVDHLDTLYTSLENFGKNPNNRQVLKSLSTRTLTLAIKLAESDSHTKLCKKN